MYKRLVEVKDFRIFNTWRDDEHASPHIFGRRTLIYGPNGSGKSTLADIFRAIEASQTGRTPLDARLEGIRLELQDEQGKTGVRAARADMPATVVYNRAYAEENLGRAFQQGGQGVPLYVLGEPNLAVEAEIESLTKDLEQLAQKAAALDADAKNAAKELTLTLERTKQEVSSLLAHAKPDTYNVTKFNVKKAEQLLSGGHPLVGADRVLLEDAELEGRMAELSLSDASVLPDLAEVRSPVLDGLARDLADFARAEVTSDPIQPLRDSRDLADWVQRGMQLHIAGDPCAFCENGGVSEARLRRLEQHFDDSFRAFHERLADLTKRLDHLESEADGIKSTLASQLNAMGKTTDFGTALERYWADFQTWLESGRRLLARREAAPFDPPEWEPPSVPEAEVFLAVNELVESHNRTRQHELANAEEVRAKAERAILAHVVARCADDHEARSTRKAELAKELETATQESDSARRRLRALGQQRGGEVDGHRLAGALTDDLSACLGHGQLRVEYRSTEGEEAGYVFFRNSEVAHDLSEGERNAVSLLYFLRSLESEPIGSSLKDACIIIDDPVSSLDQNVLLSVFSFLSARTTGDQGLRCAQLIILTHNFEFFRIWRQSLRNQLAQDADNAQPCRRASVLELGIRVSKGRAGAWHRKPHLREMNKGVNKWDSEYYYLFQQACVSTQLEGEELLGLTGNAMRRVIESFVRWKQPQTEELRNTIEAVGSMAGVPPEVTARVLASLNMASHRGDIDITQPAHSITILEDIRAGFEFIRTVDPEHYAGMCSAVGIKPLLVESGGVT